MKRIVLISCAKKKRHQKSKAKDLYVSPLFIKSLEYATRLEPDAIFILSAKHGLLNLDEEIDPYDLTLNSMSAREVKEWAARVVRQLSEYSDTRHDHFVFLASLRYRKNIIEHLSSTEVPLGGLSIGKQLQYLNLSKRP